MSSSTGDPLLIGLDSGPPSSEAPPSPQSKDSEALESDDDSVVNTAEQFMNKLQDTTIASSSAPTNSPVDESEENPQHSPDQGRWSGDLPAGAITAASGEPFTDFDSASYKASQMAAQTGDEFAVQALSANHFVVLPQSPSRHASGASSQRSHYDDESSEEDRSYLQIPIKQLRLKDFPRGHPVHKCGLSRYKRYMKKEFKFKPSYRSMWPLLLLIIFGVLTYFYPISTLNLIAMLPFVAEDYLNPILTQVTPEKLAAGVSAFGGLLAAFAFGKVFYQRHVRRYMLHPGFAKYEEGILRRESTKIAYVNIVNYDVKQGIIGRLMNYGTLELSSAGSDGAELAMHNVLSPRLVEVVLEGKMEEAKRKSR